MEKTKLTISRSLASPANEIFIIDCLKSNELQSARLRHEDILDQITFISKPTDRDDRGRIHHLQCQNKQEFKKTFEKIISQCKQGTLPLIFIDGHGDSRKGLALPSGEFINWKYYCSLLNRVTSVTGGELTVVAAFCHSMAIKEMMPPGKRLPFAFYYGYTDEISAGLIQTETTLIHESLLKDGGQQLFEKLEKLTISLHSEYEHVQEILAPILLLAWAPNTLAKKLPELSRGKLRTQYERTSAAKGEPLSGKRKKFNQLIKGSSLASKVIEGTMHNTSRRERLLQEIREEMDAEKKRSAGNCATLSTETSKGQSLREPHI